MKMYPARNDIRFYRPYTCILEDQWGESLILTHEPDQGNILNLGVAFEESTGDFSEISFSGNFHDANRQNAINFLQRLQSNQPVSSKHPEEALLVVPHPKIVMWGYLRGLSISVRSATHPQFFSFEFTFQKALMDRQPERMGNFGDVLTAEGKAYFYETALPDYSNVRDFANAYFDRSIDDSENIMDLIKYNDLTPSEARALGGRVKAPVKR